MDDLQFGIKGLDWADRRDFGYIEWPLDDWQRDYVAYCTADVWATMQMHGITIQPRTGVGTGDIPKEFNMQYRQFSDPVTYDALETLDSVKADPLWDALVDADVPPHQRTEVINRLINHKIDDSALSMQAKTLARHPEPKGSTIRIVHSDKSVTGKLGGVLESANGGVAIEIDGRIYITAGNTAVYVWPPEEPEPQLCNQIVGIHIAYGQLVCDQPKGHTSAHEQKYKPMQCTKTRDRVQCAFNEGHTTPHNYSKQLNKLRGQNTPAPTVIINGWTQAKANDLWQHRAILDQFGRQIRVQDGFIKVEGKVTDAWYVQGAMGGPKIFVVIDGKIYPLDPEKQIQLDEPITGSPCSGTWTREWDRSSPYYKCEKIAGHGGKHGQR